MKLSEIGARLGCAVRGDGEIEIAGVAGMEHAGPGQMTFLANPKYAHKVRHTRASAILAAQPVTDGEITTLVSANPYLDFARALEFFYRPPRPDAGNPSPRVVSRRRCGHRGERVHRPVRRRSGRARSIGRNAVLHPHVVIYEGAEIGDDFHAHSHVRGARVLPHRPPRDAAERRGGGRRRLRLRQARRRHALQDRAIRRHRDRRRRRDPDADLGGPRDHGRDARQARARRSTAWCRSGMPARWARTTSSARRRAWRAAAFWRRNVLLAGQVGVSGPPDDSRQRRRLRAERHRRRRAPRAASCRAARPSKPGSGCGPSPRSRVCRNCCVRCDNWKSVWRHWNHSVERPRTNAHD